MYKTNRRFIFKYSSFSLFLSFLLFSLFLPVLLVLTFSITFFLAIITDIKITKTNTSFLAFLFFLKTSIRVIVFSSIKKIFNIREVFFFFFNNNVDIYCRKVLVLIWSLFSMILKIFLIVLVVFISLVSEKLGFSNKYINKKAVSRFIFSKVFIFLFY